MIKGFRYRKIALLILLVSAWFALILQFKLMLTGPVNGLSKSMLVVNFFSYFTILSNLLVAICTSVCLLSPASAAGGVFTKITVQSAIAVYIFIVGLVYNLVLRQTWSPTGWQLVVDNLLHVAVPLLYILYWFFFTPRRQLLWKHLLPWLIFPALYLCYTLIRGEITGWYPYPFVDAGKLSYGQVAINSLGVLAAILLTSSGVIAINRYSRKPGKS